MTDKLPAIAVENVSKKFRLFNSHKERLMELLHPFNRKYHREFWALKDINFIVEKGSTVGILGRNGSGKSTLLQIIAAVMKPTSGAVKTDGRISALLELGAGFNPELTGRSNVLFNGSIMGYSGEEMKERARLIEEFADIGDYIDQPVKFYSSGMFVRLAFAAAINVSPDILIIDEALSVGDAKFQHKCYKKFIEFQEEGKTILFVSHSADSIVRHCSHAVLLENGGIFTQGKPKDVINTYHEILFTGEPSTAKADRRDTHVEQDGAQKEKTPLEKFIEGIPGSDKCVNRRSYNKNEFRYGNRKAELTDYLAVCGNDYDPISIVSGEAVEVYSKYVINEDMEWPVFGYGVKTLDGIVIYANNTCFMKRAPSPVKKGEVVIVRFSARLNLKAGDYFMTLGIAENKAVEHIIADARHDIMHLNVMGKNNFDGIVDMDASFEEVSRTSVARN